MSGIARDYGDGPEFAHETTRIVSETLQIQKAEGTIEWAPDATIP
jgi:hypothetical protein